MNRAAQLSQQFPQVAFQADYPLAEKTYFKIGGPAEVYLETADMEQLAEIRAFCFTSDIPVTLVGGASNVIVADKGIDGLVIKLTNNQVTDLQQTVDGDRCLVRIDGGTKTALAVSKTVALSYTGLEYFLGVPGTVAGAIFNNAHYLQDLIGEHIYRVQVITPQGEISWLQQFECDFGYDHSRFQTSQEIIVAAEFALLKGNTIASQQKIAEATRYRAESQPLGLPSSGCIFQNAPNTEALKKQFPQFADRSFVPGGFLIDQAGLKGAHEGDIEVSDKHAAFFINRGQGTAEQVRQLIDRVKKTVKMKFGVELTEEVFYLE